MRHFGYALSVFLLVCWLAGGFNNGNAQPGPAAVVAPEVKITATAPPAHWDLIDDLAFEIYANNRPSTRSDASNMYSLRKAYHDARFFLGNMEKVRKGYVD